MLAKFPPFKVNKKLVLKNQIYPHSMRIRENWNDK